jgi:uncharacterized protein YjgD (DUF1641 family)
MGTPLNALTAHNYDNIEETMQILHAAKKSKMLDTLENYRIYVVCSKSIEPSGDRKHLLINETGDTNKRCNNQHI